LGRGSPHQPNWLFWECKPTYIAENKTYLTLNDKITGLFIDFALRQGLKQPLPNFFL
jgi:hypothetical protein